jgi:hypothetical protein
MVKIVQVRHWSKVMMRMTTTKVKCNEKALDVFPFFIEKYSTFMWPKPFQSQGHPKTNGKVKNIPRQMPKPFQAD